MAQEGSVYNIPLPLTPMSRSTSSGLTDSMTKLSKPINTVLWEVFHMEIVRHVVTRNQASTSLEGMGFDVGNKLCQKLLCERGRIYVLNDIAQFVFRDIWTSCFNRPAEAVKTNHKDIYVVNENKLPLLCKASHSPNAVRIDSLEDNLGVVKLKDSHIIQPYLCVVAGIIAGAFYSCGVTVRVTVGCDSLPKSSFTVTIINFVEYEQSLLNQ